MTDRERELLIAAVRIADSADKSVKDTARALDEIWDALRPYKPGEIALAREFIAEREAEDERPD